ncbi:SpoIIE family protein phosphatase [Aliivibrio sp. S3MY1]|uniref:SpoIIE family protein phosphatase n=1 Tax=unclassified Aliivibrio TaxID=2645654 RepID=UPI0023783335|nr:MULTISPECIES: SpoIIE family protein phosphatase [unclassified Aliivibrio]MDD9194442.1 SpoIIE family protein phosphatase [Aliivibrio sp. S3MY1]MDD9198219.1 SpoIIE family protein phosphatase [Aliivibrio sp. S2MY1]
MSDVILLFENTQPTSLGSVRVLRQSLSKVLDQLNLQQTFKHQCLLCFSEWSTNLVLHPNKPSQYLTVTLKKTKIHWQLSVTDDGEPWDPTLQEKQNDIGDFSLKCNGRGIDIIQSQTNDISYHSTEKENVLTMRWSREGEQRRPRLLIVEDDAIQCKLYQAYLREQFHVVIKTNGEEALNFLKNETVDLIISDIQMPKMGGLELRQRLESEKTLSIPFIFLSHLQDNNTLMDAADLGIDDYLEKPIKKETLIRSVLRVLARFNQVYRSLSQQVNQKITHTLLPQVTLNSSDWKLAIKQKNTGHGGGDFVLSMSDENTTQLLLADVMGHDESAKFFAYAYAGYIRGLMQSSPLTQPAQLLSVLSDSAYNDQLLSQTMLTSCCISLTNGPTVKMSSAGHPAPLHIKKTEPILKTNLITVPTEGILLGLLPHTQYQETEVTLQKGERLALFTDGLFESGNSISERQTLEQSIKEQLINTINLPLETAIETVMQTFDSLAGTPPNDDALLLIIEKQ